MFEMGSVPMAAACAIISSLSIPTSGLRISSVVASAMVVKFSMCLRRDLANHLTGHERLGAPATCQVLGDAKHQAAVNHHTQFGGDREQDLLLQLTEGDQKQPRRELVLREKRGDLADFLL